MAFSLMLGVAEYRSKLISLFIFEMSADKSRPGSSLICPHLSLTALANGVLVCNDNKKFGGVIGMGKRYIDVFGNKSNHDQEE